LKKLTFLLLALCLLSINNGCKPVGKPISKAISNAISKVLILFGFRYGKPIRDCKKACEKVKNSSEFCERICKTEIFDSKWKFLGFDDSGNADFFYIEEINQNIVKVRLKQVFSERGKQNVIERMQSKLNVIEYENLDYTLYLLKIDCFKRKFQMLEASNYASDGSILNTFKVPKSLSKWFLVPSNSNSDIEKLFEEVCVKRN